MCMLIKQNGGPSEGMWVQVCPRSFLPPGFNVHGPHETYLHIFLTALFGQFYLWQIPDEMQMVQTPFMQESYETTYSLELVRARCAMLSFGRYK